MRIRFLTLTIFLISIFALAPFAAEPKRIVVLGDSIAAGLGVDPEEAYPALLEQKIEAAHLPYTVVNAGQSGDTTAGGLRRIDWLLKQPIDILIIELGGNDGLRGLPVSDTRSNLQAIIDRTHKKQPTTRIVIAGMKMPTNMGETYTRDFEQAFIDIAKKNDASLIPFLLEGIAGDPNLNQPDRIHPTAEGHKTVANTVWRTLQPLLHASANTEKTAAAPSSAHSPPRKND